MLSFSNVRILLLSDVHANIEALRAVLDDAQARGFDRVISLGDAVGYGPNPVEVLETLESLGANCIVGNHDEWLLSIWHGEDPQHYGVIGMILRWQLGQLSARHISQLRTWVGKRNISTVTEEGSQTVRVGGPERIPREFLIIHGSPRSTFEYVDSISVARTVFGVWPGRLAFVGHTHIPGVYTTLDGPAGDWTRHHSMPDEHNRLVFPPKARWIANPGSVGQPRDGDPRASYGFYDDERGIFEVHRVAYPLEDTQRKLREAGLPEPLAARLTVGR